MKTWYQVLVVGMISTFLSAGATAFAQAAEEAAEVKKEEAAEVKKAEAAEVKKAEAAEVKKAEAAEVKKEEPNWSVGAGFGFSVYSWGYVSSLDYPSGIQPAINAPLGNIFVERRLNRSFALLLQLQGSYLNREDAYSDTNQGQLGLAAGARWILNPAGFVRLSFYSVVGGSWIFGKTEIKGYTNYNSGAGYHSHVNGYDIGLGVGFAAEMKLLDNLYLRLETLVARFGYQYYKEDYHGYPYEVNNAHYKSIYVLVAFSPTIQLRMAF